MQLSENLILCQLSAKGESIYVHDQDPQPKMVNIEDNCLTLFFF